jgi:hypothetical protein
LAGLVGLIGLLGSAFAYIITEVPELRKVLFWHDEVKIAQFQASVPRFHFAVTASNIGDGNIILMSIIVEGRGGSSSASYAINTIMASNTSISQGRDDKRDDHGNETRFDESYGILLATASGKLTDTIVKNSYLAFNNSLVWPCLATMIFNEGADAISSFEEFYKHQNRHLVTERVNAFAVYYSVHNRTEVRSPFPAVATFLRPKKPECQAQNYDD